MLKNLLADLHSAYFKPNRFGKSRQRFQRTHNNVIEEVEFQSSRWNAQGDPLRFYVNISVGFRDIPMTDGKPALTGKARLPGLAPGAPTHYDITPQNYDSVFAQLVQLLPVALNTLPKHYNDVREFALRGSHCVLPVPDSWRTES